MLFNNYSFNTDNKIIVNSFLYFLHIAKIKYQLIVNENNYQFTFKLFKGSRKNRKVNEFIKYMNM